MNLDPTSITAIAALITGVGSIILSILNFMNNRKKVPAEVAELYGKTQILEEEVSALQVERLRNLNREITLLKQEQGKEVTGYKVEILELQGRVELLRIELDKLKVINQSYRLYLGKYLEGIYILVGQLKKKNEVPEWMPPEVPFEV
jgi:hypothetical protein